MLINIIDVKVHNDSADFTTPFFIEVMFESIPPGIKDGTYFSRLTAKETWLFNLLIVIFASTCLFWLSTEIEFRLVYVASADNTEYDQELESILVGPVPLGKNKIMFEAPAPDPSRISNLLDMTLLMLSGLYKDGEFIRVGYYIRNSLRIDPPLDSEGNPILPPVITPDDVVRKVLIDEPRVTRFQIPWDGNENELLDMLQAQLAQDAGTFLQGEAATPAPMGDDEEQGISLEAMGEGDEEDEEDEASDDGMVDIDIENEEM